MPTFRFTRDALIVCGVSIDWADVRLFALTMLVLIIDAELFLAMAVHS